MIDLRPLRRDRARITVTLDARQTVRYRARPEVNWPEELRRRVREILDELDELDLRRAKRTTTKGAHARAGKKIR